MAQILPPSRKSVVALIVLASLSTGMFLTGCATQQPSISAGNLAAAAPAINQELARDAVAQLRALYAPANTQFNLARSGTDSFGVALVAGLRDKGYALVESKGDAGGVDLEYLVDQPVAGLYRVALTINGQTLTRAYMAQNGTVGAAGAWARRVMPGQSEKLPQAPVRRAAPVVAAPTAMPTVQAAVAKPIAAPVVVAAQAPTPAPAMSTAALEASPKAVPVSMFLVNANERTTMEVLRRWARIEKMEFSWTADVDYPLTARMRAIEAPTFAAAMNEIRAALEGTRVPLVFAFNKTSLNVSRPVQEATRPQAVSEPTRPPMPPSAALAAAIKPATVVATSVPAPVAEKSWDAAARNAAGVLPAKWAVGDGSSLRAIVEGWGKAAGVRVQWENAADYPVTDAVKDRLFIGTFKEALGQLAGAFGQLPVPIGMKFSEDGRVMRVFSLQAT